jgi:hypothetical protein
MSNNTNKYQRCPLAGVVHFRLVGALAFGDPRLPWVSPRAVGCTGLPGRKVARAPTAGGQATLAREPIGYAVPKMGSATAAVVSMDDKAERRIELLSTPKGLSVTSPPVTRLQHFCPCKSSDLRWVRIALVLWERV